MADRSPIEWTGATWNPTTGCDRISPGCDNCYALALARRLKAMGTTKYQRDGDPRSSGPGFGLTIHPHTLTVPLRWRASRFVFVDSMSDLFHPEVPDSFIAEVLDVMRRTPQHTYQLLTKRSKRLMGLAGEFEWPDNLWLGVSIENDAYTFRARHLATVTGVPVRFLSLEPLLGPVPSLDLDGIDWMIVGGESGPDHRPVAEAWVRELRDRAVAARVPFFFKQWGGRTPKAGGRELEGRTWDERPAPTLRRAAS